MTALTLKMCPDGNVGQHYSNDDWSDYEDLINAIERDCEISVNDLLSKGCRLDKPGSLNSPLHLVVEKDGWGDIVKRLLERGARVDSRNEKGDTALHHAFLCEAPDEYIDAMVSTYLQETNENLANSDGLTYLHIVSASSKLAYVKELLNSMQADVDAQILVDSKSFYAGFTALHFAVECDDIHVASCLLDNGASAHVQDTTGRTPLHLACYRRNFDMIDLLLAKELVCANLVDICGMSHFMAACTGANPDFANKYLLTEIQRHGAVPDALINTAMHNVLEDQYLGYTPLHFAAMSGRAETVKMLLSCGANCRALTAMNETPFKLARERLHEKVCQVLSNHCENCQAKVTPNLVTQAADTPTTPYVNMCIDEAETTIVSSNYEVHMSIDTFNCKNDFYNKLESHIPHFADYGIYFYDD